MTASFLPPLADDERQQAIDGLRRLADWLEQHPSAPVPHGLSAYHFGTYQTVRNFAAEHMLLVRSSDYGDQHQESVTIALGAVGRHQVEYVVFASGAQEMAA